MRNPWYFTDSAHYVVLGYLNFPLSFGWKWNSYVLSKLAGGWWRGEENFARQHLFFKQIIQSSNCNSQVSSCTPNCPLAGTMKEINTCNFFLWKENICDPLPLDVEAVLEAQLWQICHSLLQEFGIAILLYFISMFIFVIVTLQDLKK